MGSLTTSFVRTQDHTHCPGIQSGNGQWHLTRVIMMRNGLPHTWSLVTPLFTSPKAL